MTPDIRLFTGDCRAILPALAGTRVDTIITDPVWPNCPPGKLPGADGNQEGLLHDALMLVPQARRVVIIISSDSDPRFLKAVPDRWPFFRVCIMPYALTGFHHRKLGGMEIAYCFGEPIPWRRGQQVIPGIAPAAQPQAKIGHPTPRMLAHMRWLVRWWSEPGETVLDPFMGSGTTAVACEQLDRRFIGIEIEPAYVEIARQRVAEAKLQPRLPMKEMVRETQAVLP